MAKSFENLSRQMGKSLADVLFEGGSESKQAAVIEKDLAVAVTAIGPEAVVFFQNPVFDLPEKEAVLAKLAAELKLGEETRRFLSVVIAQGLLKYLPVVSQSFSTTLRARRGEVAAVVRSAFKLSAADEENIRKTLEKRTGKKVSVDVHVDPELIGGVVANVGGVVFDASIRGYLERMQEELAS